jgi:hypothetical protein
MTYPVPVLPDLLVGWQKVADRYNMPIYVFQTADTYHAVSNEAQGVGHLVDTLAPRGAPNSVTALLSAIATHRRSAGTHEIGWDRGQYR